MPGQSKALKKVPGALDKLKPAIEAGKKGKYKQAAELLKDLISAADAPPEAWLLLGRALHALQDHYRAIAAFNDYIRQKPNSADGYLFAGRSYLAVSMPYKAVSFLRKALELSPGSSVAKALLGIAYLKSKNSQAAVQLLEAAVEAAPTNRRIYRAYLNALMVRGIRLNNIEDYEMGLQMLRFVLANGQDAGIADSTLLRLELGRAAREAGWLEEALEHFTAALEIVQRTAVEERGAIAGDRRIRWSRVSILMALGRNTEARKEIEIIRSVDRDLPELPWNNELVDLFIIRSLLESGEWRRAGGACREWLKHNRSQKGGQGSGPGAAMVHALYAEALRNLGNYEDAHNHLQRALDEAPRELEFWYADILVSWERMDYTSLKKALRAAEGLGGDETIISRFKILCRAKTGEDPRAILKLLQNAIRQLGPEPELMYALGETYLKTGLLEESLNWFKKTLVLQAEHQKAQLAGITALEALLAEEGSRGPWAVELTSFYDRYLKRWPANTNIRRERAMFLVKTFDYDRAIPELEKLLAMETKNPSLRRLLAYAYRKTGRYREAAVYLNGLLRERPWDIGLLLEYGGCLERTGSAKYALSILEKAMKAFEVSGKKPDTSAEASRKWQISDISLALGILHFRQKNTEKSFDYLREAAALAPKDPRPYQWMAEIARKNGDQNSYRHFSKEAQNRQKQKK
ncbi:MAG: tetratricopeptide repeat protein [Treponema sp.]|nr:tetratricopeptide repeat protein [Treponema sp.]